MVALKTMEVGVPLERLVYNAHTVEQSLAQWSEAPEPRLEGCAQPTVQGQRLRVLPFKIQTQMDKQTQQITNTEANGNMKESTDTNRFKYRTNHKRRSKMRTPPGKAYCCCMHLTLKSIATPFKVHLRFCIFILCEHTFLSWQC